VPRLVPGGNRVDLPGSTPPGSRGRGRASATVSGSRHSPPRRALVAGALAAAAPESLVVLVDDGTVSDPAWQASAVLFVADWTGLRKIHRWAPGAALQRVTAAPFGPGHRRAPTALSFIRPSRPVAGTMAGAPVESVAPSLPAARRSIPPGGRRPRDELPLLAFAQAPLLGAAVSSIRRSRPSRRPHGRQGCAGSLRLPSRCRRAPSPLRAEGGFALVSYALRNPSLRRFGARQWSLVGVTGAAPWCPNGGTTRRSASRSSGAAGGPSPGCGSPPSTEDATSSPIRRGRSRLCASAARPRDEVGLGDLSFGHLVSAPLAIAPDHGTIVTAALRPPRATGIPALLNEALGRVLWYARFRVRAASRLRAALRAAAVRVQDRGGTRSASAACRRRAALTLGPRLVGADSSLSAGTPGRASTDVVRDGEPRVPGARSPRGAGARHLPFGADRLSARCSPTRPTPGSPASGPPQSTALGGSRARRRPDADYDVPPASGERGREPLIAPPAAADAGRRLRGAGGRFLTQPAMWNGV